MPFDDRQRGNNARSKQEKFNEKNGNYSPSARYLYGGGSPQHQHQNQGGGNRREQHKRDSHAHHFDRLVKQNDIIIRLLKEIRDRLPAQHSSQSSHKSKKSSKSHRANHHEQAHAQTQQQAQPQPESQAQAPELRIAANGDSESVDQPVSLEMEQNQE